MSVVTVLALAIAGALILDSAVGRKGAVTVSATGPGLASQAPRGALSSTWFCPAAAADNGPADGRVAIANPTPGDITGTLTVVPSQGTTKSVPVRVPPRSRSVVRPGDIVPAAFDAVLVQLDGAGGGVEEVVRGALGDSGAACATGASDHWYFAAGSTDASAQLLLSLFNPFPGDAVVDLDFATDTGRSTPANLQGVVVPGRGMNVIDVGQHVRRRQIVSTEVSVRSGRIVAGKIELRGLDGSDPKGVTFTIGAPAPATEWFFADGVVAAGVDERYELYNPTDRQTNVQVGLVLDRGSADPFTVMVPAHDRATLDVNAESRIPQGVAHAAVVRTTNDVAVVAERVITATAPSTRVGISELVGAPRGARQWLFVNGGANSTQDEWLVAFNPGPAPTKLSISALVNGRGLPLAGLQDVPVPPGARVAIRLGDHINEDALVTGVDASEPVVVERDLYHLGGLGMSSALGIAGP